MYEQLEQVRISTDQKVLEELSNSHDTIIRMMVAKNKNASVNILAKLSEDKCSSVRAWIALNENTPLYILNKLSDDPAIEVRSLLSGNINSSEEILLKLAKDPANRVGYSLAQQGRLSPEVIEILIETYRNDDMLISKLAKNPYLNKKIKQMLYILTGDEKFRERLRIDN